MATSPRIDRDDPRAARQVVEQLFPQPAARHTILTRLLKSADAAHKIAPNAWAVTLFPNLIRLNVGQVEVFVAFGKGFFINCAALFGTPLFDTDECEEAHYRSVPLPQCRYWGTAADLAQLPPPVEKAHLEFVNLAARSPSGKPRSGTPLMKAHSAGLITYARSEIADPPTRPPARLPPK